MMKKVQKILTVALCVAIGGAALVACDPGTKGPTGGGGDKCTVTFYNATGTNTPSQMTVIRTVEVEKGSTVASFTPDGYDGYEFVDWFGSPSKTHKFDFAEEITSDTPIFGGFSKYVEDTRDFYVIGGGTFLGGWNKVFDDYKFTKAADKNEYTITLDLTEGDEFVICADVSYHYKHGAGYMVTSKLPDGTTAFSGMGSVYDGSTRGANIKVEKDGNYVFTLTTHPNEDYNDTTAEGYDPADPTIKSVNPYDTISWVRKGELSQEIPDVVTDFYIKGQYITDWKDMYNDATKMVRNNGVYTLDVYLKANDQFMFTSRDTDKDGAVSTGTAYLKADKLDEASKAYVDGTTSNITAKAAGKYTFVYTESTGVLSVTFDGTATQPTYDYYLDGSIGDSAWGAYQENKTNKFTVDPENSEVYKLENVTLNANDEFVIRAHDAGETELGWGNVKHAYNFTNLYLAAGDTAFVAPAGGTNVKVATTGTYDITFNSYSKMITVTAHAAE